MSKRKSAETKKRTGSKNVPVKQRSCADQIKLVAPAGLPEPPSVIDGNADAIEIYYNLGSALMMYDQLYQNIDSYVLAMAALSYTSYHEFHALIEKEGAIIEEKKSHVAIDPETGKIPSTKKKHPAYDMKRDAMGDYLRCIKVLTLDMPGRTATMVQMSMVKALHGNGAKVHPASKFFILETG